MSKKYDSLLSMVLLQGQDISQLWAKLANLENDIQRIERIELGSIRIGQSSQKELIDFLSKRVAHLQQEVNDD